MEGIVDRIENEQVIVEINDEFISINIENFPHNIEEGDVVKRSNGKFIIIDDKTEIRKVKMDDLLDSLFDD